jgi:hypothetical protein
VSVDAYAITTTWPWSEPSGSFFVIFLVISAVFTLLGLLVAVLVGDQLDGPVQTTAMAVSHATSAGIGARGETLVVGRLPRGDQVFVAALLGGLTRLEAALATAALSSGWLRRHGRWQVVVLPDVTPEEPILQQLKAILDDPAAGATPRHRLRTAALRLRPQLEESARRLGLMRPAERRSLLILLGLAGVVVATGFGLLRAFAEASVPGDLLMVYYVVMIEAALGVVLAIRLTHRHRQARAWLAWVDDAIDSLRADVRAGRPVAPADVTLVAAVDGMALGQTRASLGLDVFSR